MRRSVLQTFTVSLRQARGLTGLTQRALAELAGVKHSALADVEAGRVKRPSHDFVVRVVRALHKRGLEGMTAEQLFPVVDDPKDAAPAEAIS